jgi:hypothetical protein
VTEVGLFFLLYIWSLSPVLFSYIFFFFSIFFLPQYIRSLPYRSIRPETASSTVGRRVYVAAHPKKARQKLYRHGAGSKNHMRDWMKTTTKAAHLFYFSSPLFLKFLARVGPIAVMKREEESIEREIERRSATSGARRPLPVTLEPLPSSIMTIRFALCIVCQVQNTIHPVRYYNVVDVVEGKTFCALWSVAPPW